MPLYPRFQFRNNFFYKKLFDFFIKNFFELFYKKLFSIESPLDSYVMKWQQFRDSSLFIWHFCLFVCFRAPSQVFQFTDLSLCIPIWFGNTQIHFFYFLKKVIFSVFFYPFRPYFGSKCTFCPFFQSRNNNFL